MVWLWKITVKYRSGGLLKWTMLDQNGKIQRHLKRQVQNTEVIHIECERFKYLNPSAMKDYSNHIMRDVDGRALKEEV